MRLTFRTAAPEPHECRPGAARALRAWPPPRDRPPSGPDAIARAIAYAIEQPDDVDVNEIVVRPTAQT